ELPRSLHARACGGGDLNTGTERDRFDLLEREMAPVELDHPSFDQSGCGG
ncbi:MAG: hypothetical protein JO350_09915, partial [Candidatus Eremiobacteraeota bacterium]|nr:hypothetical protein [Candidatus Eremiobacteraeota bacterium]